MVHPVSSFIRLAPCTNAKKGQTHHKCAMKCNFDGSCEESVTEETCGCDGEGYFTGYTNSFEAS